MINFNNTYTNLPNNFYAPAQAQELKAPKLLAFNRSLSLEILGPELDKRSEEELAALFSGQIIPQSAQPIALAYAGHQFGNFVPQLGDGRALLLGEVVLSNHKRYDIQLKGSGRTPFSRGGDGNSSLGPVIREYIVSEAMYYLGVPTTRALAAVATGEEVYRETAHPGGILTRVAASHIRIGTFEYLAANNDLEGIKTLTKYCINRHYPELHDDLDHYISFIKAVSKKQAKMVAKWMSLGFIHGVMNTDNMTISGETIDFGPCAFMDNFSDTKVFSSIDRHGRYAYNNQLEIAKWNLTRLASCFIPIIHDDEEKAISILEKCIHSCFENYSHYWIKEMAKKFGIKNPTPSDEELIKKFLMYLEENSLDFTQSFRLLSSDVSKLPDSTSLQQFMELWKKRLITEGKTINQAMTFMQKINPIFIPRNHQVENAIQGARQGDLSIFNDMIQVSKQPFTEQSQFKKYALVPKQHEKVTATFCGT